MIKLHFGASNWASCHPFSSYNDDDYTVKIPDLFEKDKLPLIVTEDRRELMERTPDKTGASVSLRRYYNAGYEMEGLLLFWIEERNEWVAIWHRSWTEGGGLDDDSYSGPYALNGECCLVVLRAYGLSEEIVPRRVIRNTSPERLRELANRNESR